MTDGFKPLVIHEVAHQLGVGGINFEPYGRFRAKINLDHLEEVRDRTNGHYVLVTAITPTPFGEGKTTVALGLSMALNRLQKRTICAIRQSSLGPTFGIKGGGAGGGASRVIPLEDSILHVTGDIHAIGQAHNLIAALVDNSVYHKNPLEIDPAQIAIRRVVDVNDRYLRSITIGQGKKGGIPRETGFDITVASELMAILALCDGNNQREALRDLRQRIGKMVVAFTAQGTPISADQVRAAGAATVLMRETLKPTLMQTAENTPVFIHAGPFANIAHGNSSILADRLGLKLADFVVTEAGFGSDIGAEKFFDIKCRRSGLVPSAAVIVATIRALKLHSGHYKVKVGKPLPPEMLEPNPEHVREGCANLRVHIENVRRFGVPVVVALNSYPGDAPEEVEVVREIAREAGARGTAVCDVYARGGAGGLELASMVVEATAERPAAINFAYPLELSIAEKIERVATTIYRADGVEISELAAEKIAKFEAAGFGNLPICLAKTPLSLSHDEKLKGVPTGYLLPIRDVRASVGAGFIYPIVGSTVTMPALSAQPSAFEIDIDDEGRTVGLF